MKLLKLKTIKNRLAALRGDRVIFFPLIGALICVVVGALIIPVIRNSLPTMVPLFYSLPRQEERLASRDLLYLLPLASLVVFVINFLFLFFVTFSEKVISRMLSFSALLVSILSLYTLIRIIMLIV